MGTYPIHVQICRPEMVYDSDKHFFDVASE